MNDLAEALAVWDLNDPQRNDGMLDSILDAARSHLELSEGVDLGELEAEVEAYDNAEARDEWPVMAEVAKRYLADRLKRQQLSVNRDRFVEAFGES